MTSHFLTDVSCHPATRGHDLFNLAFEGVLEAWCFLLGFFILDNIFVINAFHQRNHRGNTRSPQHRVFPSVTAHGFTKVAALCCGPSLHSLKADPSKKRLPRFFPTWQGTRCWPFCVLHQPLAIYTRALLSLILMTLQEHPRSLNPVFGWFLETVTDDGCAMIKIVLPVTMNLTSNH